METRMKQEGAQSDSIKGYKLPVTDVDTSKRNFPGFKKKQVYSLQDLKVGQSNVVSTETKGGTKDN
jgi:hypothetical protein